MKIRSIPVIMTMMVKRMVRSLEKGRRSPYPTVVTVSRMKRSAFGQLMGLPSRTG